MPSAERRKSISGSGQAFLMEDAVLEMRPACECCDKNLPPDADARICSFECTFCVGCADDMLKGVCPNCGGGLVARPTRAARLLTKYPPSAKRVVKEGGCASQT